LVVAKRRGDKLVRNSRFKHMVWFVRAYPKLNIQEVDVVKKSKQPELIAVELYAIINIRNPIPPIDNASVYL